GRGADTVDALGLVEAHQYIVTAARDGYFLERMVLILDIDVVAGRGPIAENSDARRVQPNRGQAVGLGIGKWPQQQRIHNAEDGAVGSDSDGQREHNNGAEAEVLAKHAQGIAEVV